MSVSYIATKDGAALSLRRLSWVWGAVAVIFAAACDMIPTSVVWLSSVDFEVDPGANRGRNFVCHITVAYSSDLYEKLKGISSQEYFSQIAQLKKNYKDSIEVFSFDMITGKNQMGREVSLRSYTKAKGAFVFAAYTTPGQFKENVGLARHLTIRFLPSKMELHSDISLDDFTSKFKE